MWDVLGRDGGGGERGDGLMTSRLVVETRIGGHEGGKKNISKEQREVLSLELSFCCQCMIIQV